jgi:hypothetical protein
MNSLLLIRQPFGEVQVFENFNAAAAPKLAATISRILLEGSSLMNPH